MADDEVKHIKGAKAVVELPPGEWHVVRFRGVLVAASPDHPTRLLHPDGTVEIIDAIPCA